MTSYAMAITPATYGSWWHLMEPGGTLDFSNFVNTMANTGQLSKELVALLDQFAPCDVDELLANASSPKVIIELVTVQQIYVAAFGDGR